MKIIDNMPIIIVITALLLNITIGISSQIGFTALMIRCMVVTVVFSIFGYIITGTIQNAVEISSLSRKNRSKAEDYSKLADSQNNDNNTSTLDIKVPPLDYEELSNMEDDGRDDFLEVNPAMMGSLLQDEQDNNYSTRR